MQQSGEFERHRPRLFGIAYRMLGSRSDADDVLQDAYLRWHRGTSDEVRSPEAWLVTIVTRLCIDRLRSARAEREHYIGPWLPEPLIGEQATAADAHAELSSSLSIAFLVVLEQLAPDERAAFLLHEVFDTEYAEIAEILGKSEAACRQIVSRARRRVRGRRPRAQVTDAARRSVLERFATAIQTQDKSALLELVAEKASWTSDGGGRARAALKVIRGRERVVRFIMAVLGRLVDQFAFETITVNGEPALALRADGNLFSILTVRTDGLRILDVYQGYPFSSSSGILDRWRRPESPLPVPTTPPLGASSSGGSEMMRRVLGIWSGCVGRRGSLARLVGCWASPIEPVGGD